MHDPYLQYILTKQPPTLEAAMVLFDDDTNGPDRTSPHVVTWDWIDTYLSWTEKRVELLGNLKSLMVDLVAVGVRPQFVLIGGSFLSLKDFPKDIDFLLFYDALSDFDAVAFGAILAHKRCGLDYRAVPTDGSALLLIKTAVFFHFLYEGRKGGKGSIMVTF